MEIKFVVLILFLLMSTSVIGKDYYVNKFDVCYGNATIRIEHNTNYSFVLNPCGLTATTGTCPCRKNMTYTLSLPDNIKGNFNVFVSYYIKPKIIVAPNNEYAFTAAEIQNEMSIRNKNFIIIAGAEIPVKEPFNMTPGALLTLFIILAILIVSVIIYFIVRKLRQDDD